MNENRLSASGEESGPVELKSRDVVQFGVNVNVDKKGEACLLHCNLCVSSSMSHESVRVTLWLQMASS